MCQFDEMSAVKLLALVGSALRLLAVKLIPVEISTVGALAVRVIDKGSTAGEVSVLIAVIILIRRL